MVRYYVKKIIRLSTMPIVCQNCNGGNLVMDAILASTGPTQDNTDYTPSVLCISCETLMIITSQPGAGLGLQASTGNEISMRS
jgi:hypothetical protein